MIIALNKPLWATSNNIATPLTEREIFALCGDLEHFMASKGIVCRGVNVQ